MITHLIDRPLDDGDDEIWVEDDAYRHLIKARRLGVDSRLRLVDGQGGASWATLDLIERRRARLRLGEPAPVFEPALGLDLVVASLRRERASWLVEKATELGVRSIRFLGTERAPRSYGEAQLDRFRRVARAALEQSHGARLPELSGVHAWSELAVLMTGCRPRFYLSPAAETSLGTADLSSELAAQHPGERRSEDPAIAMLIGPEGGWSAEEERQLAAHDCLPRRLGARILRIETAAVAAAAILLVGAG